MKSLLKCVYVQYNRIMYENEDRVRNINDCMIHVNRMNTEQYIIDKEVLLIANDAIDVLQSVYHVDYDYL